MTSKTFRALFLAFAVGFVFTLALPPPQEASAQVSGPTIRTPQLTVTPGNTSVQNLTVNGTCTGCVTSPLAVANGGTGTTTSTGTGSVVLSASPAFTGAPTFGGRLLATGGGTDSGMDGTDYTGFSPALTTACTMSVVISYTLTLRNIHTVQFGGSAGGCQGTSNATTFTITAPADFCYSNDYTGARDAIVVLPIIDNGVTSLGQVTIGNTVGGGCTWTFGKNIGASGGFTASGTKGVPTGVSVTF